MSNDPRTKQVDARRRLNIELGTTMQLEFEGVSTRLNSVLVGIDSPSLLVVRVTGDARRVAARLFKGNDVVVRFVYRGTVFGFQSTTLGTIAEPARLLFIAYPKVIAEHRLRDERRVDSVLPGKLVAEGKNEVEVVILDLSASGCRVTSSQAPGELLPGAGVSIAFSLPGVEDEVRINGTVRNVREGPWGNEFGVQFADLDDATRTRLCTLYIDAIHARLFGGQASADAARSPDQPSPDDDRRPDADEPAEEP